MVGPNYSPVFVTAPVTTLTLRENLPVGTQVMAISAVDNDPGLNGQVRYGIAGGDPTSSFALDGLSGALTVNRVLNVDVCSSYRLTLVARDLGSPPCSSNITVLLSISRSYGRTPIFVGQPYVGQVYENSPVANPPLYVTQVIAEVDGTSSTMVSYALVDTSVRNTFDVDESTGVVTSVTVFDREMTSQFVFEVVATVTFGKCISWNTSVVADIEPMMNLFKWLLCGTSAQYGY